MRSRRDSHRNKWLQQIMRAGVPSINVLFSTFYVQVIFKQNDFSNGLLILQICEKGIVPDRTAKYWQFLP